MASTGFIDPSSGLAGLVDYNGTVRSDGKVAHSQGTVTANKLRLVKNGSPATQPVAVEYASDYDLRRQTGTLSKGQVRTGKSTVDLGGTYDLRGDSPMVHMKMNAPSVPVHDIEALLPAVGIILPPGSSLQSGAANANLSLDGPADRLVTTGNVALSNAKLSGFSLGSKMSALSAFTGMKPTSDTLIQMLSSQLRIAPEGMRADNLKLIVANLGTITGAGTIGAGNSLDFKMMAQMASGSALGNVLGGLRGAATRGVPFRIQGTTAKPIIVPDIGGMLRAGPGSSLQSQPGSPAQNLGNVLGGLLNKKKKQ